MKRGELWWADFGPPRGSEPAFRRPVLVVQADAWNESGLATVIVVALTSTVRLGGLRGNVVVPRGEGGLAQDSVANVTQLLSMDRSRLRDRIGLLPAARMASVADGLRAVLAL